MTSLIIKERARAKVNLTLHVGALIEDAQDRFYGYHPLDSLVVFADVADEITLTEAQTTTLNISGKFASSLSAGADNLILKAVERVREKADIPNFSIQLEKNIPVSAGLGGGSANAAAVLRALEKHCDLTESEWQDIALSLGADVPVCRLSKTAYMTGIGECIDPLDIEDTLYAVLINPLMAISTAAIFQVYDNGTPDVNPDDQITGQALLSIALGGKNDLQPAACGQLPLINEIIHILSVQNGCELARMSGSGASCFGVFQAREQSEIAAQSIAKMHPEWWVVPTVLGQNL